MKILEDTGWGWRGTNPIAKSLYTKGVPAAGKSVLPFCNSEQRAQVRGSRGSDLLPRQAAALGTNPSRYQDLLSASALWHYLPH